MDTGQERCFDRVREIACPDSGSAFFGQDPQHGGVAPAYSVNGDSTVTDVNTGLRWTRTPDLDGDGTITDRATGLMWSRDDSGVGMDWEEALAWVQAKNANEFGGHSDWRLPDAKELQGLVDYTRSPDATGSAAIDPVFQVTGIINEAGQPDFPAFWTSTTHANSSETPGGYAVYVCFGRAMGYMNGRWMDVHGAGAQRGDPKTGDPGRWPRGHGPQGDAIRIHNFVRLVRDAG